MKKTMRTAAGNHPVEQGMTPEELRSLAEGQANAAEFERVLLTFEKNNPAIRLAKLEAELEKALKRIEALERKGNT